jgi:PAS domain S-box-containing protein
LKKITLELLNPHDKEDFYINYSSNNELGRLVYYFNKRTRELKESEAYSKAIFEQSPVPIQIFDKKGIAIDANKAWENMWGMDKRDFNGKYNIFRDKIFKNSKEFKYIHDVFNGKPYIIKKFEYKLKTVANIGRDRILNVIMFPIKDTNSNIVRVVVIQEDITDKVKMEESIQRIGQLEALGELSAGVAHDFNNILTGMVLNLEMLEIKLKGNREAIRFINKIKISMDSAKNLIHKIRMVSRREEHKMFPCKLNEILKESLDIIKPAISSNIDLKVHILGNHFWIECDKNSINQLIMNLIINARDAIKTAERSNGLIEITLKEENNFIILKVSDNGIGIPEEIKERIFEPFFSTKQKTEHRGTGLGLSIVFNIVIMHKGEIAVKSEVGKGTTFTVKFYLLDYQIDDRKEDKKNIRLNKSLYNKTVLLVEDEDNVSEAESEILKYLGFKVVNAKNGKEAVDIVKSSEKIDIVLIDWDMPIMNGEKAILDIRKINQTIPIFIVSGAISERMEKFKNSGLITEIINKPFKKDEIIEKFNFYIN